MSGCPAMWPLTHLLGPLGIRASCVSGFHKAHRQTDRFGGGGGVGVAPD